MTTVEDITTEVDAAAAEEFVSQLVDTYTGGLLTALLEIGRRTSLFEHAALGPVTSAELAARAGLQERYVREWLAAMVTGGIVEYDAAAGRYWLPAEHVASLTGTGVQNLLPLAYLVSAVAAHVDGVTSAFREGGGVPYASYLPQFHDVMDQLWQPMYRDLLVEQILTLVPGLVEQLESGIRLADVCCGSGNGLLVLAERFPRSRFVGYDSDADAIAIGTAWLATIVYSVSLLHCMTVSLAQGGAGLGTGWGEELALSMLADAGFGDVAVHDAPDPFNAVYVTHGRSS